jgi:transposase
MTDFFLSDAEWALVGHLFSEPKPGHGRPRRDCRGILTAILWVQRTGEKWHRLPSVFPSQQTCFAKCLTWRRTGILQRVAELIDAESPADLRLLQLQAKLLLQADFTFYSRRSGRSGLAPVWRIS